ncbi:sulfurtransferase TusA family protein [Chloroflexota bacterium]
MTEDIKADITIDLQGLLCPIPVVKINQAVKNAEVGQVIEASATDPGVLGDIPAWCRTTGNELVKMDRDGKVIRFWVKKVN